MAFRCLETRVRHPALGIRCPIIVIRRLNVLRLELGVLETRVGCPILRIRRPSLGIRCPILGTRCLNVLRLELGVQALALGVQVLGLGA